MGGIVEERLGPAQTSFLGGLILSGGVAASAFVTSLGGMVVSYGVCFGIGLALAYPCPLACGFQWMPRHKGLVSGLIVSGFGGGAFVFNEIATTLVNPNNYSANIIGADGKRYHGPDVTKNVPAMLIVLGACYLGLIMFGSMLLRNPPKPRQDEKTSLLDQAIEMEERKFHVRMNSKGKLPRMTGKTRSRTYTLDGTEEMSEPTFPRKFSINALRRVTAVERKPTELLREPQFYHLAITFVLTAIGGLFVAGTYKSCAQKYITDDEYLTMVGSVASICNAAGRLIVWGPIADLFGFQRALLILTACLSLLLLTYNYTFSHPTLFLVWTSAIFLCYGGNYVVYPTATAQLFGVDHSAANYGMVFLFTGCSAVVIISCLEGKSQSEFQTTALGVLGVFGFFMAILLRSLYFRKAVKDEPKEEPSAYG